MNDGHESAATRRLGAASAAGVKLSRKISLVASGTPTPPSPLPPHAESRRRLLEGASPWAILSAARQHRRACALRPPGTSAQTSGHERQAQQRPTSRPIPPPEPPESTHQASTAGADLTHEHELPQGRFTSRVSATPVTDLIPVAPTRLGRLKRLLLTDL